MNRAAALLCAAALTLSAAPASARTVADPIADAKAEIERTCLDVDYPDDFAKWGDLNGDGRDDLIVTYSVTCNGYKNVFCGRDGCKGGVYVEDGAGGYLETGLSPDLEATIWKGWPAVTMRLHGSNCGLLGSKACKSIRVWNGQAFVRPTTAMSRIRPPTADDAESGADLASTPLAPLTGDEQAAMQREALSRPSMSREELHRMILARRPREVAAYEVEAAESPAGVEPSQGVDGDTAAFEPPDDAGDDSADADDQNADDADGLDETESLALAGEWSFADSGGGLYVAEILGQDGGALLRLSCARGDGAIGLHFRPANRSGSPGTLTMVDFWVGRRVSESRLLEVATVDLWRDRLPPRGRLLGDLRRGVWLVMSEPGRRAPLGRFALRGSSRAIAGLVSACRL